MLASDLGATSGEGDMGGRLRAQEIFDLTGETALITGASSGFGARFAEVLAANGAKVTLLARRKDRLDALAARIEAAGGRALAIAADASDEAELNRAFSEAEARFGTVTILIANAGIARPGRAVDAPMEDWRETLKVNLEAPYLAARIAARRMIGAGKTGSIVNTASITARVVERGLAAYAVSKAGLDQLTRALALELGPKGVRVNAIAPGYVATEINADYLNGPDGEAVAKRLPLRRLGRPEDLDAALLTLAAPRAGAWMTGETIVVDGGHLLVGA
jgi:3-oxoacyl-[acyl-carrier protein] reductase